VISLGSVLTCGGETVKDADVPIWCRRERKRRTAEEGREGERKTERKGREIATQQGQ
jgi:hypothetical protein